MQESREKGWRNDGYAKVTGKAKFTGDLVFGGMLHAVPVYSDHVHAVLTGIDTAEAEKSPGVVRVLTHRDVPGSNHFGQIIRDFRIFADDRIRYHGDVVAVVVAESREAALRAVPLVRIDAEPLPALLDPEEAMKPDAPLIHEKHGSNIINTHHVRRGDVERGFAEADLVLEKSFSTQFIEHAYMEAEVSVALPRPDGTIEVYGSMQHPFSTRRFVAACLGLPLSDVEVIGTPLGGGFGGKDDTAAIVCARTALAAWLLNRPVKMAYRREWSIRESYKRHPYRVHYRMGLARDGRITAIDCRIIADGGAYCSVTPWVTWRSTVQCCGPYVVENVHCDTFGVYTNNVVTGAMRGFGSPQMNFVIESLIEEAAERLGLSGIALRRRNMVRQGSVTITGQKLEGHTVSLEEVLDRVLQEIDYEAKLARCSYGRAAGSGEADPASANPAGGGNSGQPPAADPDELYGIGLAMSYRGVSLGAEGVDFCAAIVNVQADGSVLLEAGIHENGQGSEAAMSLILARELGIEPERIRYRRSSTSVIPDSGTTVASRGTIMGGGAVALAAQKVKKKIAESAAADLGCTAEAIRFARGRLHGPEGQTLPFDEAIRRMFQRQQFPYALGVYRAPQVTWNEENGQGNAYFTWVYGCQAVELTVNRKSGEVRLLNAVACHDVGKAINNTLLLGQFFGGMAMGAGYALHEDLKVVEGRITHTNLNRYKIPRPTDLCEMRAIVVENPDPVSPTGAKSIGEPTNEIMAPAIANAIYHATGVRYYDLPIRIGSADARTDEHKRGAR
jgi:CO/xanthine dehydrogenase Mo-binding subunit